MGGGNMSSRKVKLGDVLIKKNLRLKDVPELKDPLVLGVTNNEGVVKSKVDAGQKIEDYYVIEKGDFVYNPYRINVGSIGISELEGITSLAYVVFNVDEARLNKYLLFKLLKSDFGIKEIIRNGRGSVRNALRFDDLARIELTLPSIEEQNAFVESFRQKEVKLELLKNHYTYQLSLLENLNQAILQEAVQGKLVPQDDNDEPASELLKRIKAEKELLIREKLIKQGKLQEAETLDELLFDIPKSWVWCKLDEICKHITDGTHQTPKYTKEGRIFLSAQNVKPFKFMPEEHKYVSEEAYQEYTKNGKPEIGDILIGRVGAGIGETAVIDKELDFCIYVSLALVQPFKTFVDSNYLAIVFNSPYGYKYAKGNISSKGGSAGNFNLGRIRSFLIPLPPLSEQKRIVAEIEKQFAKTKQLKEHILANQQATEQLLKALLHQAFEVKEAEEINS